jgi:hypothetical protein
MRDGDLKAIKEASERTHAVSGLGKRDGGASCDDYDRKNKK